MKSDYYDINRDMLSGLLYKAREAKDSAAVTALNLSASALRSSERGETTAAITAQEALEAWRLVVNPVPYWDAKTLMESIAGIDSI